MITLHRSAVYVTSYGPILCPFFCGPAPAGAWWVKGTGSMLTFPDDDQKHVVVMDNTTCTDVIGHELIGHGVPDAEGVYATTYHEGGAIQEGQGDVFGQLVNVHATGSTSWKMADSEACTFSGFPLRDLADPEDPLNCPTCTPGASNYSNFLRWKTSSGSPSVHRDGGIIGKLGWLIGREPAEGSVSFGGQVNITGVGHLNAGALLHDVMTGFATATTDLNMLGILLRQAAHARFGFTAPFFDIQRAVNAVGLWRPNQAAIVDGSASSSLRPGVEMFQVGTQNRAYYVSSQWDELDQAHFLHVQHKPCILSNNCQFSQPVNLGVKTSTGVGIAKSSDKLHAFYAGSPASFLSQVTMDSNGDWSAPITYPDITDSEPAVASYSIFGSEILTVYYRAWGWEEERQPIRYINILASDGSVVSGPFETSFFAEGGLGQAEVNGVHYIVYVDEGKLKYFTLGASSEVIPPLQEDVPTLVGSATATSSLPLDRLHVAALTLDGTFGYKSFCPSGAACTYRPGEWTNTVALPPPSPTAEYVALFADPGVRNTVLMHNGPSSLLRRLKMGE
jgi:hypothetical protein